MAGASCSVKGCRKYVSQISQCRNGISFHNFPKDQNLKQLWIKFCQRGKNWVPKQYSKICSLHFNKDDFETSYRTELLNIPTKRRLNKTAFPTRENSEDGDVVEEIILEYTESDEEKLQANFNIVDIDKIKKDFFSKDVKEEVGVKLVTKTEILRKEIANLKRKTEEQEQTICKMRLLNESLAQDLHKERHRNLYLVNKMNLLKRENENEVSASHGISGYRNEIVLIVTNDEKHN